MKFDKKVCLKLFGGAMLLFICIHYWEKAMKLLGLFLESSMPLLVGFAIAYVLNILMSFYEKHYFKKFSDAKAVKLSRRAVCLTSAILTLIAITALIIWLVIPELALCLRFLIAEIPSLVQKLMSNSMLKDILSEDTLSALSGLEWNSYITKAAEYFVSGFSSIAGTVFSAVSSVFTGVFNALISIIFAIYILLSRDRLKEQCRRLINCYAKDKWKNKAMHLLSVTDKSFHSFIVGQCIEAVILGVLCTIGMLIFGFPYATMIGALVGFTALVPIAGAFIGAGAGAVMILTVSPVKALLFIVFIVVLQQLEENLIYPKVVGKSVGLPSIWVLAAITVGGGLMGIMGMLVAVPIVSAAYKLLREDVEKREEAAITTEPISEENAKPE